MKAQKVNRILKGKHPKTLLEVFSIEEDDMPVVAGKRYGKKGEYTAKDLSLIHISEPTRPY